MYEWDEAKRQANFAKHGVDFALAARFDWDSAKVIPDTRHDFGESRETATGWIGGRLHVLTFTLREQKLRIISLRKANKRETRKWEEN